jgi:hypothetical protein
MSTELSNLPSDPSVPNQGVPPQLTHENIKMETTAYSNNLDSKPSIPPIADNKQLNSMMSEIQNVAKQGLTRLAEDIPQQTNHITQDPQSLPNAIPNYDENSTPIDYIQNHATHEEVAAQLKCKTNQLTTIDIILEEIKIPLFIAILYYLFQSKQFKKIILSKIPYLFNDTGSYSTNGYLLMSLLFGTIFYILVRIAKELDIY